VTLFMTWNIKTGGIDRDGPDRLDAIIAVVAKQRPDILALQELKYFGNDHEARLHKFAAAVGMTPHFAPSAFGLPVAVLVRPPLRMTARSHIRVGMHHAAAAAVVPTGAGPLTVVSTHLNPYSPNKRRREARRLARSYHTDRTVLAGDLNTLDPVEDHAEAVERLPEEFRRRHLRPDGTVDTRPVQELLRAGLTDLWTVAGDGDGLTAPTSAGGGHEFSGMRLDYVLASPAVAEAATGMQVIRGGEAEYASDHYPVTVRLAA
jgi:exodeoxyribonuclease III